MNWWQVVLLQILLITTTIILYYDPTKDYETQNGSNSCLQNNTFKKICVQCYDRNQNYPFDKGYVSWTGKDLSVLKIRQPIEQITCKQLLHFVDYEDDKRKINIDMSPPIYQLIKQMKGQLIVKQAEVQKYVIEPQFKRFAVFRWSLPTQSKDNQIQKINVNRINIIYDKLAYFSNVLFVFLVLHLSKNTTILKQLSSSIKGCLICFFLIIQLICFHSEFRQLYCVLLRILIAILCLTFTGVPGWIILLVCGVGCVLNLYKYGTLVCQLIIIALFVYSSNHRVDIRPNVRLTLASLVLLFINYSVWIGFNYNIIADGYYRIAQLCIFFTIAYSIVYQPQNKQKGKFTKIKSIDPQFRSISLSGFQQNDDV